MSPRAPAMAPDERRAALVDATVPLLRDHGRGVTTRQIAQAAGVAEGTIFRVFDSKDDLVDAAVRAVFNPYPVVDAVRGIPQEDDLRPRLLALVRILQSRYREVFELMRAIGLVAPPPDLHDDDESEGWRITMHAAMLAVVAPYADRLRLPPERFLHLLRLLTFAGSHAQIADGDLLSPREIVDVLLDGALAPGGTRHDPAPMSGLAGLVHDAGPTCHLRWDRT